MKSLITTLAVTAGLAAMSSAHGALDTFNSPGGAAIPDYPDSGLAFQFNYDHADLDQVTGVSITFTTSGGWNGDLYAYLSHGDGLAILLNRVGASTGNADGYGTSGFNTITLSSAGVDDIHLEQFPTTAHGAYEADGRIIKTDPISLDKLDVFNGRNPNGNWTLFFADMSPLNSATLDSWSVAITAVPEPTNAALLGCFAGLFVLVSVCRSERVRRLIRAG